MATPQLSPPIADTTCPECGNGLALRHNGRNQRAFYGCQSYPACLYTRTYAAAPQQMPLPCTLDEAAQLREQLVQLQGRCTDLQDVTVQLEQETTALRAERDAARREVDDLRLQVRATQFLLELAGDRGRTTHTAVPAWLDGALRQILVSAHPDRWCQGQPATALAHEIATALNGLRQRLEGH